MSSNGYPFLCTARGSGHQQFVHKTIGGNDKQGRIQGEGAGGAHPPPRMTCGRFLINIVQSLDRHTKSALSFDMCSQQFTLCYFPVKSPLLRIRF